MEPLSVKISSENANSPQKGQTPECSPRLSLSVPSPIITRRTRTNSMCARALLNPQEKGKVKYFCRAKGHGFIIPNQGGDEVFLHISDIEGEYIPKPGDEVAYRLCPIPPKFDKNQAVHVEIINFTPEVHLRWDAPSTE